MKLKLYIAVVTLVLLFSCKKDTTPSAPVLGSAPPIAFTIPSDSVVLDPNGVAPLSALVSFTSPVKGSTLLIVKGKNGPASDIQHLFTDSGYYHSIPVIGLYAAYTNTVDIYIMNSLGDTLAESFVTIATNPLPAYFIPNIITMDVVPILANIAPGINLVNNFATSNPQMPFMVDNFGDIRWLLDYQFHPPLNSLTYECGLQRLRNGNFFFGDSYSSIIYEVDLLGKILNSWPFSQGYTFHHHVIEIPNGNFIATATLHGSTHTDGSISQNDYIVEIDRKTSSIDNVWDLKESLDEYRRALDTSSTDWFHGNALLYDSTDNTIIVSGRVQGVAKLDFNNDVKWILSPHKGWGKNRRGEDLNNYLLKPLDASGNIISDTNVINGYTNASDFQWNWYQHCPIFMPNRDIMVFDDGTFRNFNFDTSQPKYSRAVEYKIDTANMTVQQIWQYGQERGIDTWAAYVSSVQYLPSSNHVMFCPGYHVINTTGKGGKIVEVDYATGQVVSELSLSSSTLWGFHRAYRIDAYPPNQ